MLTQRCSSSIQSFIRFLSVKFDHISITSENNDHFVAANYTVQILPTVLQKIFYNLCGLTLQTIFDLKVPGATIPIRNLLSISGDAVTSSLSGLKLELSNSFSSCPSLNALSTATWHGFDCPSGEILRYLSSNDNELSNNEALPECC